MPEPDNKLPQAMAAHLEKHREAAIGSSAWVKLVVTGTLLAVPLWLFLTGKLQFLFTPFTRPLVPATPLPVKEDEVPYLFHVRTGNCQVQNLHDNGVGQWAAEVDGGSLIIDALSTRNLRYFDKTVERRWDGAATIRPSKWRECPAAAPSNICGCGCPPSVLISATTIPIKPARRPSWTACGWPQGGLILFQVSIYVLALAGRPEHTLGLCIEHNKAMGNPIRVAIADDHPMIRVGVRRTLERYEQFRVVAEAADGRALLNLLHTTSPDVLLLDIEMPHGPTPRLVARIRQCSSSVRIVILSAHTEARYLQPLRELDISGFMVKDEAPERLLQAVRVVHGGETWFSHSVSEVFSGLAKAERTNLTGKLTRREQQIFELMQLALDNATIAEQLHLSKQTVRRYATIIYEKLGVKNRIQAIVEADNALREPAPLSLN